MAQLGCYCVVRRKTAGGALTYANGPATGAFRAIRGSQLASEREQHPVPEPRQHRS